MLVEKIQSVLSTVHAAVKSLFTSVDKINTEFEIEVVNVDTDSITDLATSEGMVGSESGTAIQTILSRISVAEADIDTAEAGIATNSGNIALNAASLASQGTRITALEDATDYSSGTNYQELPGGLYRIWGTTAAVTIQHGSYGGPGGNFHSFCDVAVCSF